MQRRAVRLAPLPLRAALLLLVPLALLGTALLGLLAQSASAHHTPAAPSISGPASPGKTTSPAWGFDRPQDSSVPSEPVYDESISATRTVTIEHDYSTECVYDVPGTADLTVHPCGSALADTSDSYTGSVAAGDGSYVLSVRTRVVTTTTESLDSGTGFVEGEPVTSEPVYGPTASATYLHDTTAPRFTITGPTGAAYSGWTVTRTDTGGSGVSYQCTVTGPGFTWSSSTCNIESPVKPALGADGSYTLTVVATDDATNSTSAASDPFTYDGVAPSVTVTRVTASPQSVQQPVWTYAVGADAVSVQCVLTGPGGVVAGGTCADGTYTAPVLTTSGTYTLSVTATDAAGNVGGNDPAASGYVLDRTPPTIAVSPASSTTGTSAGITWGVTVAGGHTVTCEVSNASTVSSSCTPTGGTVTASRDTDGVITLKVTAVDAYGNAAEPVILTYTRDTTPAQPTVSVPTPRGSGQSVTWTVTLGASTTGATCALTRDGSPATDVAADCADLTGPGSRGRPATTARCRGAGAWRRATPPSAGSPSAPARRRTGPAARAPTRSPRWRRGATCSRSGTSTTWATAGRPVPRATPTTASARTRPR